MTKLFIMVIEKILLILSYLTFLVNGRVQDIMQRILLLVVFRAGSADSLREVLGT